MLLCNLLKACNKDYRMPQDINTGMIEIISKGGDRLGTRDYRSLIMLNIVYKVMAKAMALRIKALVVEKVHPMQFDFVHARSIHEAIFNAILAIDRAAGQWEKYVMVNMDLERHTIGWSRNSFLKRCRVKGA